MCHNYPPHNIQLLVTFPFAGLCLNSLGSNCAPKKTKLESHSVVVYVNSTPYCTSIELEHHRGPCRCECDKSPASCSPRQHFIPDTCTCQCLPGLARDKLRCVNSTRHTWNSDTCQCGCKYKHTCAQPGQFWDEDTCTCQNHDTSIQCTAATNIILTDHVASDPSLDSSDLVTDRVYLLNFVMLSIAVAGVMTVLGSLFILRWSRSVRGQDTDPSSSQWTQEDSGGHEEAAETVSFIDNPHPIPHCTLTLVRSSSNVDQLRDKY